MFIHVHIAFLLASLKMETNYEWSVHVTQIWTLPNLLLLWWGSKLYFELYACEIDSWKLKQSICSKYADMCVCHSANNGVQ